MSPSTAVSPCVWPPPLSCARSRWPASTHRRIVASPPAASAPNLHSQSILFAGLASAHRQSISNLVRAITRCGLRAPRQSAGLAPASLSRDAVLLLKQPHTSKTRFATTVCLDPNLCYRPAKNKPSLLLPRCSCPSPSPPSASSCLALHAVCFCSVSSSPSLRPASHLDARHPANSYTRPRPLNLRRRPLPRWLRPRAREVSTSTAREGSIAR